MPPPPTPEHPAALTLTPTAESARALRRQFDTQQRARNLTAWQPPNILSWAQFLEHLWSAAVTNGIDTRLLLNPLQEHALWLDTVTSKQPESLTSPDALAALAAAAWQLAHAYNAAHRLRATATTHDARTFADWATAFARGCDRNQYLTRAALSAALTEHIASGTLPAPPTLTLAHFLNLAPAQQTLLDALQQAGTTVTELFYPSVISTESPTPEAVISTGTQRSGETPLSPTLTPTQTLSSRPEAAGRSGETCSSPAAATPLHQTTHLYTAPSEAEELRAIATYARTHLEQNPTAQIALLLPTPDDAPTLETTFRDILAPELNSILADTSSTPWQFPTAGPLTAQPILATALHLLQLTQSALEIPRISALLLSPYLGTPEDRDRDARFDAETVRTHQLLRPELDLATLLRLTRKTSQVPSWLAPLSTFLSNATLEAPRSHADWAEFTRALLRAANYPGPRTLTPLEYQTTEALDALLDNLSTLDFRGRRIPFADFLRTLNRQATTTPFTPANTNAPIQILTPASALGQTFDLLILPRATDTNYPIPEARTNPLLSFALQSQLDMPGANPLRIAARAEAATRQLLASAPKILLTYTPITPQGEQRPSPLLTSIAQPISIHITPTDTPQPIHTIPTTDDAKLPPLPTHEVSGGARLLKLQAACGFLAFSELRLRSTELNSQTTGFDAIESGNFLHRALHAFWSEVKTQQNLRNLTPEQRTVIITRSVNGAVDTHLRADTPWDIAYLDLQKERLRNVLEQWHYAELERGPFEVVALETKTEVEVGPLTLRVVVDRTDKVSDGFVFVDYKTGYAANPSQWDDARPEEPQLPLYTLLSEPDTLKGLAFAKVRAGKSMSWLGYQAEEGILPQKKPTVKDLEQQIDEWRNTLAVLATDFANGIADVNPKDFAINCKHCAQRLLCRINPESFLAQPDDSDDPNPGDDPE